MKSRDTQAIPLASEPGLSSAGTKPSVLIVGGGLAGMSAANALCNAARVTLLESKRRTGGRAGSFTDPVSGTEIDYCQHVAMGCCTHFLQLVESTDLSHYFDRTRELVFVDPTSRASRFAAASWLPAPLHLGPSFARLRFLTWREKWTIARTLAKLIRLDMKHLPCDPAGNELTMGAWLVQQQNQRRTIDRFWNLVLASALGDSVDRVAIPPARKVFVDGFLRSRAAMDLIIPNRPLSEIFGSALPSQLARQGVEIRTGARVTRCDVESDHVRVELQNGETLEADYLIAATPWHTLPDILGPQSKLLPAFVEPIPTAPISGIHLWLDRPITPHRHAVLVDRLSQWVFRPSQDSAPPTPTAGHYHQVVISAAHDLRGRPHTEIVEEVLNDLRQSFPAADHPQLLHSRVVTDPQAVFSVSPRTERQRYPTETRSPRLFVAGDFVRTDWPATMEGAVISGALAAQCLRRNAGCGDGPSQAGISCGLLSRFLLPRAEPSWTGMASPTTASVPPSP